MIQAQVQGMDEVLRELRTLPELIQKKILRRGVVAGAKIIKTAVRAAAPVRTGTLRRAIIIKWAREKSQNGDQTYIVTALRGRRYRSTVRRPNNRDAYYAPYVEKRRPFMQPTYEANRTPAEAAIVQKIEQEIAAL